jgi:chaperonin cofactor prefoldin
MNASLNRKMDDVKDELNKKMDDIKEEVSLLRGQYAELQEEVGQLRGEVDSLRKENQDLAKKVDDLQGRSKRNNIIVHGMLKLPNESSTDCEGALKDILTDKLDLTIDVEFDRVHRINSRSDSPVIACCTFFKQKQAILKARRNLQGTSLFIGEDFTERVRAVRRQLTPHLKKARADGKRATMVFDHLLIDGKKFVVDDSDNLLERK